jgi:hypothetical protein
MIRIGDDVCCPKCLRVMSHEDVDPPEIWSCPSQHGEGLPFKVTFVGPSAKQNTDFERRMEILQKRGKGLSQ